MNKWISNAARLSLARSRARLTPPASQYTGFAYITAARHSNPTTTTTSRYYFVWGLLLFSSSSLKVERARAGSITQTWSFIRGAQSEGGRQKAEKEKCRFCSNWQALCYFLFPLCALVRPEPLSLVYPCMRNFPDASNGPCLNISSFCLAAMRVSSLQNF